MLGPESTARIVLVIPWIPKAHNKLYSIRTVFYRILHICNFWYFFSHRIKTFFSTVERHDPRAVFGSDNAIAVDHFADDKLSTSGLLLKLWSISHGLMLNKSQIQLTIARFVVVLYFIRPWLQSKSMVFTKYTMIPKVSLNQKVCYRQNDLHWLHYHSWKQLMGFVSIDCDRKSMIPCKKILTVTEKANTIEVSSSGV